MSSVNSLSIEELARLLGTPRRKFSLSRASSRGGSDVLIEIAKSCRRLAADFGRGLECWRQRRALEDLDHLLKDIGISRAEALTEAGRSFWDRTDAMAEAGPRRRSGRDLRADWKTPRHPPAADRLS